jgi:PAS domain-containing protein
VRNKTYPGTLAGRLSGIVPDGDVLPKKIDPYGKLDSSAYEHLVRSVVDYAIYMVDLEGRVSSWNAGAERIKGYREDEIIGEHVSRFYTAEDRKRACPHAL